MDGLHNIVDWIGIQALMDIWKVEEYKLICGKDHDRMISGNPVWFNRFASINIVASCRWRSRIHIKNADQHTINSDTRL